MKTLKYALANKRKQKMVDRRMDYNDGKFDKLNGHKPVIWRLNSTHYRMGYNAN